MTRVWMNWDTLTLTASGHAGWAAAGKDIVCAGISALTCALVNQLEDAKERGRTQMTYDMDEKNGEIRISAIPASGYQREIKAYYRIVMTGLKAIAQQHRGHIKIREV